jgi:hypothetical protein
MDFRFSQVSGQTTTVSTAFLQIYSLLYELHLSFAFQNQTSEDIPSPSKSQQFTTPLPLEIRWPSASPYMCLRERFRLSFFSLRSGRSPRLPPLDLLVPPSPEPFGFALFRPPNRDLAEIDG